MEWTLFPCSIEIRFEKGNNDFSILLTTEIHDRKKKSSEVIRFDIIYMISETYRKETCSTSFFYMQSERFSKMEFDCDRDVRSPNPKS